MPQLPLEPELSLLSVAELRAALNVSSSAPPLPVAHVEERELRLADRSLRVRTYVDREGSGLPIAVYFHGGGFVLGTLDTHDTICRRLAADSGVAIVSIDYRLAPEHPFPAAIHDAYDGVAFLAEHADAWGFDGSRLAVVGDSAGGNLAAVACLMARDRGGPSIAHQALIYPVTDAACVGASYDAYGTGFMLTTDLMRMMWQLYLDGQAAFEPYASPLRTPSLAGLPAATVVTAEYDALRDEGAAYAARLSEAGIDVAYRHCADLTHSFAAMWQSLDSARAALAFVAERLALALRV